MFRLFIFLLLGWVICIQDAVSAENIRKINGGIHVGIHEVKGSLDTVNGSIRIDDGAQVGDVQTVNGSIRVAENVQVSRLSTVNGSINISNNALISGDIKTVNGGVFVDSDGHVGGNVATVNGSIGLVAVYVAGNVRTVSGDVTIGIRSRLVGDLIVQKPGFSLLVMNARKPRIVIAANAVVEGELIFEQEVSLLVHESARIGHVQGATPHIYTTARPPQE